MRGSAPYSWLDIVIKIHAAHHSARLTPPLAKASLLQVMETTCSQVSR
jgi:hypothetical protein